MHLLLKWLVSAGAILMAAYLIPGITFGGVWTALVLAIVLGLINITLKPLLVIITLPINLLTLGLFTFIINAILILLASSIVKGFAVDGFLYALIFAVALSIINYILSKLFGAK